MDATEDLPLFPAIPLARIRVVDSPAAAADALRMLMAADVVGFDTESKPTFRKGEAATGPHLVQLATDALTYLFPVRHLPDLTVLKAVLESPAVLKVGFGLGNDRTHLRDRLGIELDHVLDLAVALQGNDPRRTVGVRAAVVQVFAQRMLKSRKTSTSNWANRQLTERQMLYAANDADVALRVYRALHPAA